MELLKKMILAGMLLATLTASSQSLQTDKLDSFMNILASKNMARGSLAITRNGKLIYQHSIGDPVKYRIGSITKMFTATMIFQLVEEGKLQLNHTLSKYFPALPNAAKIRITDLLYHRSGLHDYTKDTNFPEWMDAPKTHVEMLQLIASKGSDFEPGSATDYSNSNFLLLGYIIESLTGMGYDKALQERITGPLRLTETYLGMAMEPAAGETQSYKYGDSTWKKVKLTNLSIHGGAGSILSTPENLARFIEALFSGKLINKQSLSTMTTLKEDYGMGIFPFPHNKHKGFGHGGRIEEFYSNLRYYPKEKIAICYITNGILYPRNDILDGMLKICFNESYTLPFTVPQITNAEKLDKYLGTYASGQLPIVVTVTKNKTQLLVETQGKVFETTPVAPNYFMHAASGYFFEFQPATGGLIVKETDNQYVFKKRATSSSHSSSRVTDGLFSPALAYQ